MENLETNQPVESSVAVNNEIREYLFEISKWGRFLAIVGYIGMGLLILLGLIVMIGFSVFNRVSNVGFPMGAIGLVYIVIAVLYFFPISYLNNFSVQMKSGLNSNNQTSVNSGFKNLKSLFKFMGIFTIVILSIYALLLVVALPVSLLFFK